MVPLFPDRSFTTGRCTSFAPIMQEILQSHSLVVPEPSQSPNPPLWCRSGHHSLNTDSPTPRHCPLRFPLLPTRSSLLPLFPLTMYCVPVLLHILQASQSPISAHPPSLPRVRDWSAVVASRHHSLTGWHQSVLVHDPRSLPALPSRASTLDSLFSSLTQIILDSPFAFVGAPPCLVHASGNIFGGMMRAITPLLLAMAPGVTSVALGHLRIRLASASCASSFAAQSVPPGTTTGTSGLGLSRPSPAVILGLRPLSSVTLSGALLPHLTCAIWNGIAPPDLPFLPMRRVRNGVPIFPLPLRTLRFPTTSSTHSLSASRHSRPYTNQADSMLLSPTTNLLLRSPSATSLRQVRITSRIHSSKSPSHDGVIFYSLSSTWSYALGVVPSAWKSSLVFPDHQARW